MKVDWSKPVEASPIDIAFPACVIGRLLPPMDAIPGEIHNQQNGLASEAFFNGLDTKDLVAKEDVDKAAALGQIQACLGSYEPKHEHKIAGVNYLFSLFFEADSIGIALKKARAAS